MKSKTIILSNEKTKGRGILTIYQEDDLLQCRLRLYSIPKLSRYCKLGVYHNKEVTSGNLLEKNGVYTSSMVGEFDIDKDFYTAIIDTQNNNQVILSGGTYAGFFFNDQSVFDEKKIEKENPDTDLFDYDDDTPLPQTDHSTSLKMTAEDACIPLNSLSMTDCETETTNNQNTPVDCNNKCAHCKYKEFFYSQNTEPCNEDNAAETSHEQNANNQKTILESLIPQFKYVFENYPQDETLNKLIPNGKFVKISENMDEYSIGAIYENDQMKYICYALLCNYNSPAPKELGEHYQWLPLDKEDPLSEGYYIVFQDAQDLKIVEI